MNVVLSLRTCRPLATAHVLAAARQDEVVLRDKVLVAARDGGSQATDYAPGLREDRDGVAKTGGIGVSASQNGPSATPPFGIPRMSFGFVFLFVLICQ